MFVAFRSPAKIALLLSLIAVILRAAAVTIFPEHFWAYTIYYEMARVLAAGGGYCLGSGGTLCAYFPPVYPTVLAAGILTGHAHAAIVVLGSVIGGATVWMVWLTARLLFGDTAGLAASAIAAFYPYFVWHDATVQETATLTLAVSLSLNLLLRAHRSPGRLWPLTAGAALALAVLTKANLLLFPPVALIWIALFSQGNPRQRTRRAAWAALGVLLLLGPWAVRTWRITGTPILYSNGGFSLWTSNHRLTFDYFPEQSIDEAHIPEWEDLSNEDKRVLAEIENNDPQGVRQAAWYWSKGMEFIRANPGLTFLRGLRKIGVAFSPVFSPRKGVAFEALYLISYLPLALLAAAGIWIRRARWRELGYIYLLIATFALGSAALWAHTSHRMYVEPSLMILAGTALQGTLDRYLNNSRGTRSSG